MSELQLPYTRDCFVCGAHNPHGLRLRFRREGDEVRADFTPQPQHAGFRGIVHGGVLATFFDITESRRAGMHYAGTPGYCSSVTLSWNALTGHRSDGSWK